MPHTRETAQKLVDDSLYVSESPAWVISDQQNRIDFGDPVFIKHGLNGGLALVQVAGMRNYKLTLGAALALSLEYQADPTLSAEFGEAIKTRAQALMIEGTDAAYVWAEDNRQEIVALAEQHARAAQKKGPEIFSGLTAALDQRLKYGFQREQARALKLEGEGDSRKAEARAQIAHSLAREIKRMFADLELEAIHQDIADRANNLHSNEKSRTSLRKGSIARIFLGIMSCVRLTIGLEFPIARHRPNM